jgi:hypothetical protein
MAKPELLYNLESACLYKANIEFFEYILKRYKGRPSTRQVRRSMKKYASLYWRRKARRKARKFRKDLREANLFAMKKRGLKDLGIGW